MLHFLFFCSIIVEIILQVVYDMKKNNVSSTPNNMVAIICKVIKGVDEDYLIDARSANFGKIEEYGTDFYCMNNKKTYKYASRNNTYHVI